MSSVLISKNVRLTSKILAKEIYVSADGSVTIIVEQFCPRAEFPALSVDYLDAICSKYYYGGYMHQDAIADVMLLNSVLSLKDYGDFYATLAENLKLGRLTIISSILFQ